MCKDEVGLDMIISYGEVGTCWNQLFIYSVARVNISTSISISISISISGGGGIGSNNI